jgi:hypothetical protein
MANPPLAILAACISTISSLRPSASNWLKVALCGVYLVFGVMSFQVLGDVGNPTPDQLEFFEDKIRPILVTHCYECHSGAESNGGLKLDSREAIRRGGDSGPAIVLKSHEQSLLIKAVRHRSQDLQMPPKGPLGKVEIELLERWIQMGAPDPREETVDRQGADMLLGMSIEEGRRFWAFMPIDNPALPSTRDDEWPRNGIDRFVLSKLEEANLEPAPEASRVDLARRVSLDLTGLPPTADELALFLADKRPDAYEDFVERLLASPQYGVRWGRHWLDVARYADSNGLDENIAFGNAWRYRDYVVRAMNQDKPIDAFITDQIAGDLIPQSSCEAHTATGFLVLGAKVLAEPDREKLTMDTIDEQLDTVGKAFLGITLGCARCHDHKFDPIKQKDYYALAAIFKSTKTFGDTNFGAIKHWNEISIATEAEKESLKKVSAEISKRQSAVTSFRNQSMEELRKKVRSQAAVYLQAACRVTADMTLQEVEAVASPLGLHARVLFQCRRYLSLHADAPLFAKWHEWVATPHENEIGHYYSDLFGRCERAWEEAKQKDRNIKKLEDPQLEVARLELNDLNGFLAIPPKPEFAFDTSTLEELHRRAEEARVFESFAPDEPAFMGVVDGKIQSSLELHIRGNHRNLGESVSRAMPEVLRPIGESMIFSRKQSGRLELARWLTSSTNPLTARVFANRVWGWHFGRGIVASTENFGKLGERPSHPELLDYLARLLIESGWSLKELQRSIVCSSTYRMSTHSAWRAQAMAVDPDNRWYWRFTPRRMGAEQIRDSILLVSQCLDLKLDGKSIPLRNRQFVFDHTSIDHTKYDSHRRAIYLPVIRNHLYSLFDQFDFPDPTMPTGHRNTTTVAPQALLLMNSDWVMDAASKIAERVVSNATETRSRIVALYREILGRDPNARELEQAFSFVSQSEIPVNLDSTNVTHSQESDDVAVHWRLLAQSLLMCNEFIFIR